MRIFLMFMLIFGLSACSSDTEMKTSPTLPSPTTAPSSTPAPTQTPELTDTPVPTPTAQALPIPTEQLADLAATSVAALPPTITPDASGTTTFAGLDNVQVMPLIGPGAGLAVAFSTGFRRFEPEQSHYIAIYASEQQNWRELNRIELKEPDYIDPASVQQVTITPDRVWLTVESSIGMHGSCYTVLSYDQQQLRSMLNSCSAAPGAGTISDIDADGMPEVLLNGTDYYVTCYVCGLRLFRMAVMRWDGNQFQQLALANLPGDSELAQVNNQAVALGQANRWREALLLLPKLRSLVKGDPIARTNVGLIQTDGKAFAEQAADTTLSPLMPAIFYGDYKAVLDYLRSRPVADLFEVERSQIFGPEVQGFEMNMPSYIMTTVEPALNNDPTFAAAHFLKGWALILANPRDLQGLAAIEQAVALAPQEPLYARCVTYLKAKATT